MSSTWIVGLGEVLWDVFRDGPVFGGAPANFACHARALGASVAMVSAVGPVSGPQADPLGLEALKLLRQRGIDVRAVQSNSHETGRVIVDVDAQGKPTYTFSEHPAWDFIEWSESVAEVADQTQAVCFGTLAQRAPQSRATIQRFLTQVPDVALKVFDVNLRVSYWDDACIRQSLASADILKLNDDELPTVARACGIEFSEAELAESTRGTAELRLLGQLIRQYQLQVLALTRGSEGATLMTDQVIDHCPAPATIVKDTVGAGDAYTAAMIIGLQKGWSLAKVNQQAVRVAAYVCTQTGATPELPPEITSPFCEP